MQETNDPISVPCGSVTLLKGAELVCKEGQVKEQLSNCGRKTLKTRDQWEESVSGRVQGSCPISTNSRAPRPSGHRQRL